MPALEGIPDAVARPVSPAMTRASGRTGRVARILLLAAVLLLGSWLPALAGYVPGELLVRFRPQTSTAAAAQRHRDLGVKVAATSPALGVQRLKLPEGLSVEEALKRYQQMPEVALAQPNYVYHAAKTPNDPYYTSGYLWHLSKIKAPAAWDVTTGSRNIVVAVCDTGVDYTHEDIRDNMSDVGWDFVNNDDDPYDDDYQTPNHGTHVAGIIGALGGNVIGVSGVCWRVKIMAVKALGPDTTPHGDYGYQPWGTEQQLADAIEYAVSHGADIINLSMEADEAGQVLSDAVRDAQNAGVLLVCAAGNSGRDSDEEPTYPGCLSYDNIVNVACSTQGDALTYYSNYGTGSVDLAAPGSSILSLEAGNSYQYMGGTSMSAAVVSGAAALLLAANSHLDYRELKDCLVNHCEPIQDLDQLVASGGRLDLEAAMEAAASIEPHSASSSKGGGCFIATAAYGSPLAGQVRLLSAFRDRWLANPVGRPLVAAYYRLGPAPARYISERSWLPPLVRVVLRPLLPAAWAGLVCPGLLGLALLGGTAALTLRPSRRR
jgi:thermitase